MEELFVWFSRYAKTFAIARSSEEAQSLFNARFHQGRDEEEVEWFKQPHDADLTLWFAQGQDRSFRTIGAADIATATRFEKTHADWVRILGKGAGMLWCPFGEGDDRRQGWIVDQGRVDLKRGEIQERRNDPIVEIDMADSRQFHQAIDLALAASDATNWGPVATADAHRLAGNSEFLEATFVRDAGGESVLTAITGDGPKSKANAEFYASARKVVLGLVSEVDRQQTRARAMSTLLKEFVARAESDALDAPWLLAFVTRARAAAK